MARVIQTVTGTEEQIIRSAPCHWPVLRRIAGVTGRWLSPDYSVFQLLHAARDGLKTKRVETFTQRRKS
jgi:hypothetical protein